MEELRTKEDFNGALAKAGDKPVFVCFSAKWCGPCEVIAPIFEELSKDFTNAQYYTVDIDENDEVAEKYGIQFLPTFIYFKNGLKVERQVGADKEKLEQFIKKHAQ